MGPQGDDCLPFVCRVWPRLLRHTTHVSVLSCQITEGSVVSPYPGYL